ncbi:MAG: hypothetical protein LWY06_06420 [Firmicutes bacterium]|nr:hypothetical protein [Bacillota bacterium]
MDKKVIAGMLLGALTLIAPVGAQQTSNPIPEAAKNAAIETEGNGDGHSGFAPEKHGIAFSVYETTKKTNE